MAICKIGPMKSEKTLLIPADSVIISIDSGYVIGTDWQTKYGVELWNKYVHKHFISDCQTTGPVRVWSGSNVLRFYQVVRSLSFLESFFFMYIARSLKVSTCDLIVIKNLILITDGVRESYDRILEYKFTFGRNPLI